MSNQRILFYLLAILIVIGVYRQYASSSLNKQEKIVMDFYRPSAERSRAAQNPDTADSDRGNTKLEVANLIAGYRNIIIIFESYFKSLTEPESQIDTPEYNALKVLFQNRIHENKVHILPVPRPPNAGISLVILYTDKAEKNALLLKKVEEEESPNGYLYGLLLGYRKDDIEFFYQRSAFLDYYTEEIDPENPFATWPQSLKDQFHRFVQSQWPHSPEFIRYQKYVSEAKEWLLKNNAPELFKN